MKILLYDVIKKNFSKHKKSSILYHVSSAKARMNAVGK